MSAEQEANLYVDLSRFVGIAVDLPGDASRRMAVLLAPIRDCCVCLAKGVEAARMGRMGNASPGKVRRDNTFGRFETVVDFDAHFHACPVVVPRHVLAGLGNFRSATQESVHRVVTRHEFAQVHRFDDNHGRAGLGGFLDPDIHATDDTTVASQSAEVPFGYSEAEQ